MSSRKMFFVLLGLACLLLFILAGGTYAGLGQLQKKGDELVKYKLEQQTLDNRQASLKRAKSDIDAYTDLAQIAKSIVPQEKDQARTVREILAVAESSQVSLASIQFPESTLGGEVGANGKKRLTTDPTKTQLTEVKGTKGLYAMEITVQSSDSLVPYSSLLSFLEKLEQNRRTAHVTNISIQPSDTNRNLVTFSVTLNVYIKP